MRDPLNKSDQIDLKLINIFLGMLESGSQTEVANAHGMSQPGINRSIKKLQSVYKDELFVFDSTAKRFYPTPKAKALGPELRKAHDIMQGTLSDIGKYADYDYASSAEGFTIAMNAYSFSSQLHRLMDCIYNISPGVSIEAKFIEPGRNAKALRKLATQLDLGEIDLILDQHSEHYADFHRQRILTDDWVVVAAETNKLGPSINASEYLSAKHIVCSIDSYNPYLEPVSEDLDIALRVPSFSHVIETVSKTSYLSTVPQGIAKAHSKTLRLKIYPSPIPTAPLELYMYYATDSIKASAIGWLRETVINTFNM